MPTNPGERFPIRSVPKRTAALFVPLVPVYLALAAFGLLVLGLPIAALVVAFAAGRLSGVR